MKCLQLSYCWTGLLFKGYTYCIYYHHTPGESPSSSASDVDNLNNPTIVDKVTLAKGVASPQVAGTHVVSARNRASFTRLFNFVSSHIIQLH